MHTDPGPSRGSEMACLLNLNKKKPVIEKVIPPSNLPSHMSEVAQTYLTLCDPTDCSLPGSSVHGIFQARVLEWVAIPFSRGSS